MNRSRKGPRLGKRPAPIRWDAGRLVIYGAAVDQYSTHRTIRALAGRTDPSRMPLYPCTQGPLAPICPAGSRCSEVAGVEPSLTSSPGWRGCQAGAVGAARSGSGFASGGNWDPFVIAASVGAVAAGAGLSARVPVLGSGGGGRPA